MKNDGSLQNKNENDEVADPMNYDKALDEFVDNKGALDTALGYLLDLIGQQIQIFREAIVNDDIAAVRMEAHKLKGGAANLTAMRIAKIATEIESLAKANTLEGVGVLVDSLKKEFEELKVYISKKQRKE